MGFSAVLALFGLLAIAIPIIVHLTKAKQAPIVWMGDIRLLKGQNAKRFRPTNIDQWPLFILRVLIVLLVTLAVAKPYWQDGYIDNRPLALISPQWLASASEAQIEQLTTQYDVAHLTWQTLPLTSRLSNRAQINKQQANDLWALLSYYDEIQPLSQDFHVFVSDRLGPWFAQHHPEFSRHLNWHILPDKQVIKSAYAVIVTKNSQMFGVNVLTQALELLGFKVRFESTFSELTIADPTIPEPSIADVTAYTPDVIFDLDNVSAASSSQQSGNAIVKGSHWLQGHQQVDFIFTLRELIEAAYADYYPARLPPHFTHGKLAKEQLQVNVNTGLYQRAVTPRFFDHLLVMLLLILVICERLLSEYGPYRRVVKEHDNDD